MECDSEDWSDVALKGYAYRSGPCCMIHFTENPHVHFFEKAFLPT